MNQIEPVRPDRIEPQDGPVLHCIGNAHIDPVWLWRWNEGLEAIRSTFRSALDRLNEYPDFIFSTSSAAFYQQLAMTEPEMLDEIRQRIREGRWEIVGGWWVEPDANIPSGEALVRQALYGQTWFQKNLGVRATVGFNPDTFGHPGTIPGILQQAGISSYYFLRPEPKEKILPDNVFVWRGLDGSEVIACRITRAYCTWFEGEAEMEEHIRLNHESRSKCVPDYTVFYGVGNHGGGPTKKNLDFLTQYIRDGNSPRMVLSSLGGYIQSVKDSLREGAELPVVTGELQHHARGCYSVHSETKRLNRQTEHLLLTAEKFAAVRSMLGIGNYPLERLTSAWQGLLYNQFHDILAGSSLPDGYQDSRDLFGYSRQIASEVLHTSIQAIASQIDTRGEGRALVVFNPLPWKVRVPVEVEPSGRQVSTHTGESITTQELQPTTTQGHQRRFVFLAELPAMGYRVYRQNDHEPANTENNLSASDTALENDFWRIGIDADQGSICELFDKINGVDVLSGDGITADVFQDESDTWSHDIERYDNYVGSFGKGSVTIEESGPVRACLLLKTSFGKSTLLQRIILYSGSEVIEVRCSVNWQEQLHGLKIRTSLNLTDPQATYEIPYGSITREATGEEEPGQQWVDVSGSLASPRLGMGLYGVSILNDSKYSFHCDGNVVGVTALRSPAYAHHDPEKLDPQKQYTYIDQGWQDFTLRIVPHLGTWQEADIPRKAMELNCKSVYVNESNHAGRLVPSASFLETTSEQVMITAFKLAETGDEWVLRASETSGDSAKADILSDFFGIRIRTDFRPFEIKTWRITTHPGVTYRECNLLEEPSGG